jgi:hypothetical protein
VKGVEDLNENWRAKFCTSGASGSHVLVKGKQQLNQSWQREQVEVAIFFKVASNLFQGCNFFQPDFFAISVGLDFLTSNFLQRKHPICKSE